MTTTPAAPQRGDVALTSRRMPLIIVVAVVSAVVGLFLGSRLPWGSVPLTVEEGVVVLHDDASGFTSFEGEDGTQIGFDVRSVVWSHGGQEGERSTPSCLSEGEGVPAEVGYRWVRVPDGGSRPFALWVAC
ncbi:hypothetical protein [Nocardioides sp.]|uniref:hypothetical protein n=1 Tax=Nocardioides sp. TaxID=35761 RepID=UPI0035B163E2